MKAPLLLCALANRWLYDRSASLGPLTPVLALDRAGLFTTESGFCIVAHRGTASLEDVLEDVASVVDHRCGADNATLHPFYQAYLAVYHDASLAQAIGDQSCKETIYTGHSLGGAVAVAAAREAEGPHPPLVVTFGGVKGCCSRHADRDGPPVVRVVNQQDPIAALPMGADHCVPGAVALPGWQWKDGGWPHVPPADSELALHHMDVYVKEVSK
jgi:hypothetical protein